MTSSDEIDGREIGRTRPPVHAVIKKIAAISQRPNNNKTSAILVALPSVQDSNGCEDCDRRRLVLLFVAGGGRYGVDRKLSGKV
jgi:hypothetical protein